MLNSHDMEHALNLFDEFNFIHLYLAVSFFRYNRDYVLASITVFFHISPPLNSITLHFLFLLHEVISF